MTVRLRASACALAATFAFGLLSALPTLADDPAVPAAPAAPAAPAPAAVTRTNGEITDVGATSITIKPRKGDAKTFTINDATKIKIDGKDATAADLKVGQRVRVNSADGTTATEISNRTRAPKAGGQTPPPAATAPAPPPAQ